MTQGHHEHQVIQTPQGPVCTFCRQVVIEPILSFDDKRLAPPTRFERWREIMPLVMLQAAARKEPIDYVLIGIADALQEDWPDYIQQVAEKYNGEPPHVKGVETQ